MNLKDATITGYGTRTQADGICYHCGMGIKHCVFVQDPETRKEVTIGTTCAERVGLDPSMIRNRITHAQRKEREERETRWEAERAAKTAKIIEARKPRAKELAPLVADLKAIGGEFFNSLADQLESRQTLSFRQADCVCKAFSVTGRRNKKNAADWDARLELILGENF